MATEIITIAEALTRVGLLDLLPKHDGVGHSFDASRWFVGWTGYPKPFACGFTELRGYGPLDKPAENNAAGLGRRHQSLARISRHSAGGRVLFSWSNYAPRYRNESTEVEYYRISSGTVVVIDELPDSKDTALILKTSG